MHVANIHVATSDDLLMLHVLLFSAFNV